MRRSRGPSASVKPRHPAPLNALRAFEAAARCLSFQAAAAQLFVTPAAVSHQVKRLEAWLGVPLFRRGHRAVALTREGEALATSLHALFGQLDLALDRAMDAGNADLRVSTVESFAAKWLAPRLHRFHRDHPGVRLRIETGDGHAVPGRDGVDVAIRYGRGGYRGVRSERLLPAPVFPVCAPGVAGDPSRPMARPSDLRHHVLVHDGSAEGRAGVPDWRAWLDAAGATRVRAAAGPVLGGMHLAQEAAIAGLGVALGIEPLVADDLQRGRLSRPFGLALDNAYAFWLVRPPGEDAPPAVDAFCNWLRHESEASR